MKSNHNSKTFLSLTEQAADETGHPGELVVLQIPKRYLFFDASSTYNLHRTLFE